MKKAKLEMETLGKILLLTAFLIVFLLMFKGCKDQMENVGTVGTNEYICWFSHALKGKITFLFPSACYPIDVEKEQDQQGVSMLMRKCWWMQGQGEEDIVTGETNVGVLVKKGVSWYDIARTCYLFAPKEDIDVKDFMTYLREYDKSGKKLDEKEQDSKKTTWGYIQKTSTEKTGVCFDKELPENTLFKGLTYYIIFYDDRGPFSNGARDRIMISRNPEFGAKQTGFFSWVGNILRKFVKLGSLSYDTYCYDWTEKSKEKQEEAEKKFEEAQQERTALPFFNNLITYLKECSEVVGQDTCYCGAKLEGAPAGYSIKVEKIDEKKYKVALLKGRETFEKDGKKFEEEIRGRLGVWAERSPSKGACGIIGQGSMRNVYVEGNIDQTYTIYHPNTRGDCKSSSGVYLVGESDKVRTLSNIRECSEVMVELEEKIRQEEQRKLCKTYSQDECYTNKDKCYPQVVQNLELTGYLYQGCESCAYNFECTKLLSEETCNLNPCSKTCKWIPKGPVIKGVCENG